MRALPELENVLPGPRDWRAGAHTLGWRGWGEMGALSSAQILPLLLLSYVALGRSLHLPVTQLLQVYY